MANETDERQRRRLMSRRTLLVFLPFVLAAMVLVGIATAGAGPITVTPSHASGWYQSSLTLTWTVTGDPKSREGCDPLTIDESPMTPYTCTAHTTGPPTRVTVEIGVDLTNPSFTDPPDLGPLPATSPDGRVVDYALPAATDNLSTPIVGCNPTPGFEFPVGTTTVNCTARDASGRSASADFTVTISPFVASNTPPTVTVSGPGTVAAESPAGAVVSYTVSVDDAEDDPDPPFTCPGAPASGTTFPVGKTTFTCSATDSGGLSGSDLYEVTVTPYVDDVPPMFVGPSGTTVNDSAPPSGSEPVNYTISATDNVETAVDVDCNPPPGSPFPVGSTTVTCTASDGTATSRRSLSQVTVQDKEAPIVTVPASMTVEANGPGGAVVNYPSATATDSGSGQLQATCVPPPGSTFPLGTTVVTCSASDGSGNPGSASFQIRVVDTTAPALTIPTNLAIQSTTAIPASDSRIRSFLEGATATDIVDQTPQTVTTNAPASFPLGVTTVIFTAIDDSGNTTQKSATVTVSPDPAGQPGGDTTPPENVGSVRAIVGNLSVSLSWKPPAKDFDHVDIVQSPGGSGDGEAVVYSGKKTSFVARGLANSVQYRFVLIAYDEAGNRAAGVAVVALAQDADAAGAAERRRPLGPAACQVEAREEREVLQRPDLVRARRPWQGSARGGGRAQGHERLADQAVLQDEKEPGDSAAKKSR